MSTHQRPALYARRLPWLLTSCQQRGHDAVRYRILCSMQGSKQCGVQQARYNPWLPAFHPAGMCAYGFNHLMRSWLSAASAQLEWLVGMEVHL